eukprot:SAG31_NODE_7_length_42755_cov_130.245728_10_plen_59_part_00
MLFVIVVPFDEDEKSAGVWYLDHDYLEKMYRMFKKVAGNSTLPSLYRAASQRMLPHAV